MEKGYLDTMIFGLSRDQAQTELVEQFQYKFAYDANGISIADSFGTETAIPLSSSQASPCMSQLQFRKLWCVTACFPACAAGSRPLMFPCSCMHVHVGNVLQEGTFMCSKLKMVPETRLVACRQM